jgi:hypothetical protein
MIGSGIFFFFSISTNFHGLFAIWAYFFLSSSCQTSNKSDKIGLAQEYCHPDHNPKLEKLVGILHSLYI